MIHNDSFEYNSYLSGYSKNSDNNEKQFPDELFQEIFSYLKNKELCTTRLVNKKWDQISDEIIKKNNLLAKAFGEKQWQALGIMLEDVPPVSNELLSFYMGQCPFSKEGIMVKDTHHLLLVPGKILRNGSEEFESFTLDVIKERASALFTDLDFDLFNKMISVIDVENTPKSDKAYWVLIKKEPVDESPSELLESAEDKGYETPDLLTAITASMSQHLKNQSLFKTERQSTWCKEEAHGNYPICFGNFTEDLGEGLGPFASMEGAADDGACLLPMRKF